MKFTNFILHLSFSLFLCACATINPNVHITDNIYTEISCRCVMLYMFDRDSNGKEKIYTNIRKNDLNFLNKYKNFEKMNMHALEVAIKSEQRVGNVSEDVAIERVENSIILMRNELLSEIKIIRNQPNFENNYRDLLLKYFKSCEKFYDAIEIKMKEIKE